MNIQSLSVLVPNKKCINNCAFCVSRMHPEDCKNQLDDNMPFYDLYLKDYLERLSYARDNGCNTVMLTGNTEPQQNRKFLTMFGLFNKLIDKPFRNIEMQTTGVGIDTNYLRMLRNHVGVNTISLSVSALYDYENHKYNGTPESMCVNIEQLCADIKKYDFNLRLSLNLTDFYDEWSTTEIFDFCNGLGADQIIFRLLYTSESGTSQDKWIEEHGCCKEKKKEIDTYIQKYGKPLEMLEFGRIRYSIHGMSVVLDNDCMNTGKDLLKTEDDLIIPPTDCNDNESPVRKVSKDLKYLILKPDCKLYTKWDDPASLLF